MHAPISLTNWSFKKTLAHITNPVAKARIIVFYFVFLLNFLKIGVVLPGYLLQSETENIIGSVITLLVTLIVLKLLLSRPAYLNKLIHFALIAATCSIWASLFIYHRSLNLILAQDIFMICMWSFYGLKGWWGLIYSTVSTIPVLLYIYYTQSADLVLTTSQIPLVSSLIIITANFTVILMGHYYYRNFLYQAIRETEKLNKDLQKSNEAKTLFFSSVSHELRNPLNTVIGMANLLKEDSKDHKTMENLDILRFSAGSLLTLINDLLDFDKMGSGKVQLESIPFKLYELIECACAGLKVEAIEKGLYFKIVFPEEIRQKYLSGDPTRLTQILYNLVGNAVKFTDKGGVKIEITLLRQTDEGMLLRFSVQDTGMGISEENQQHIFDPFTQASSTTTRQFGGTGLGLGIVKKLVQLHQSTIRLKSVLSAGTEFTFDILYQEALVLPEPVKTELPETDKYKLSAMNVLLAEDNPMNILFMKKLFERWKIKLTVAENGSEAIQLLEEYHYDLVLMDIYMPVLNGYDAAMQIRKFDDPLKADIFIIALTGSVSEEVFSLAAAAGMNDTLHKPFHPDELYQKLESVWQNSVI